MGWPNDHNLFCRIHEIIFKFCLWCADDLPQIDLKISHKIVGPTGTYSVKALPISLHLSAVFFAGEVCGGSRIFSGSMSLEFSG